MALDPDSPIPLYAQLLAALRARLQAGDWRPGDLLPTDAELCQEYGVSRITVARAMAELARAGVVQRRRRRGTTVKAPPDTTEQPAALAFLTPRLESDWPLRIYHGFEQAAAAARHYALLTGMQDRSTGTSAHVRTLLASHTQALALCFVRVPPSDWPFWQGLRAQGIPFTFVGTYEPDLVADRVIADNTAAGRLATEHLLALGHRRIVFLGPNTQQLAESTSFRDRLRGYHQALQEADIPPGGTASTSEWVLPDLLSPSLSDTTRRERLLTFLEHTQATAAVTTNDALAVLVQRYLDTVGLRTPDDLALVGISDGPIATLAEVPLTTVRIDAHTLGEAAARLLLRRLAGDASPPREVVVPVRLVVRASCGGAGQAGTGHEYSDADAAREVEAVLNFGLM